MDRDLPSLRISAVRFFVLFAAAFLTWCMALLITRDAVAHTGLALGLGLALADVLACLGVLAARWLDEAYAARCRQRVLTTPQEFPAILLPDYLLPEIAPLYEAEVAPEPLTPAGDGWLHAPNPTALQSAA